MRGVEAQVVLSSAQTSAGYKGIVYWGTILARLSRGFFLCVFVCEYRSVFDLEVSSRGREFWEEFGNMSSDSEDIVVDYVD